jgi:PAS domain S-box-containing protein
MGVQLIHAASVLILLGAGAYALRMVRLGGRLVPWAPLAAVMGVLAVFRVIGLVRELTGRSPFTSVGDELNVLLLSLLLLLGLWHMRSRFVAVHKESAHAWAQDRRLRSLIENSLDLVTVIDAKGRLLYLSPSVERVLGHDPELLRGQSVFDLIHPDDIKRVRTFLASRIPKPGVAPLIECRIQHRNATWRQFEVAGNNLLDEPPVSAIVINARDVTQRREAEAAVRASERRFRRLVENSWDVFVLINREGIIEFMSPSVSQVLGYDSENYHGRPMFDFVHTDDVLKVGQAFQEILSVPGSSTVIEIRGLHESGGYRWLEVVGTNLLEDPGVGAVVGIFRDKTERRRIEDVLRSITEGVSGATGDDFFHSMAVLLTQVLGVKCAFVAQVMPDAHETVATIALSVDGEILENFEYQLEGTPCGTVVNLRTCSYPTGVRQQFPEDEMLTELGVESYLGTPLFDSAGRPLGLMVVMDDEPFAEEQLARATLEIFAPRAAAELEREHTLEALSQSEESNRALVEHANYGIYRSAPAGRFLSVNPALVKMLGYASEEELLALDIGSDVYVDPQLRRQLMERYERAERIEGVEVEWKRKNGSRFLVRLSGQPQRGLEGETQSYEMIAEDVTEQRALEEQLRQAQKMEAIGQLTGGIAHDFNNLLTVILANADMIERGLQPQQVEMGEDLVDLRRAAQRGSDMVRKLLGYSRRGMIALRPLQITTVISDLLPTLRRVLPESIDVRFIPSAPDAVVSADEGALEQILFNLVTNARDAMPDGGVLRIEIHRVVVDGEHEALAGWGAPGGEYALVCVGDTGHGMDDATRERIFDPFFTTKPPGLGTGLGMAMIYGLVKQQDGFIEIESRVGEGTSVDLYFPLVTEGAHDEPLEAAAVGPSEGTETILLVEDEAAIRRAAKRLLEKKGYTVLLANDGVEALDIFKRHESEIDLVISDVVMPRLGGRQLYETLKRQDKSTRFLFTSGYTARDMRDTDSLDPGWPFLQKPWDVDELLRRVREILDLEPPQPRV